MDIRQTRRLLNLSQRQLANLCDLSIGTILRAEKSGQITVKNYRLITDKLKEYAQHSNYSINPSSDNAPAPIF